MKPSAFGFARCINNDENVLGVEDMDIDLIITAAAAICGIIFGWIGCRRGIKKDYESEGALKSNTEYIKRRIDDVLLEQKDTNRIINNLTERVTRVEESSKQAHKRLDGIEQRLAN
ncbi:hypothetical protein CCDG5_1979 [[Clostridium] cellulosi]|jgi:hypothetical protein|uniref:Uncharacterized protein n=1 Tax=[Clostridium] cellulosi TaxID=29343 RepID=A0A078KMS6_9FIRM|nr:hypothetical protein CCDG5_1979 [[Clostridium] cellulosi]